MYHYKSMILFPSNIFCYPEGDHTHSFLKPMLMWPGDNNQPWSFFSNDIILATWWMVSWDVCAFQCIVPYLKTYNLELIEGGSHASRGSKLHQVFLFALDWSIVILYNSCSQELEQGLVQTVLTFQIVSQQQTSCSQMKAFLDSTHVRFSSVKCDR